MNRLIIYTADIQIITGKSERQSRNILSKLKTVYNKQKHHAITIDEFCIYFGLKKDEIMKILK